MHSVPHNTSTLPANVPSVIHSLALPSKGVVRVRARARVRVRVRCRLIIPDYMYDIPY